MRFAPGPQDLQRLALVAPVERPGPPDERLLEPGPVADRLGPLRRRCAATASRRSPPRAAPLARLTPVGLRRRRPAARCRARCAAPAACSPLARATASSAIDRTVRASSSLRPRLGRSLPGAPSRCSPGTARTPVPPAPAVRRPDRRPAAHRTASIPRRPPRSPNATVVIGLSPAGLRRLSSTFSGATRWPATGALRSLLGMPRLRPPVLHRFPPARHPRVRHGNAQEPRRSGALAS